MRRARRCGCDVAALGVCLVIASSAWAQDASKDVPSEPFDLGGETQGADEEVRERARQLADEGMRLIETGEVDAGLAKLKQALALVPVPTLAIAAARAMVSVGRMTDAVETYREVAKMPLPTWLKDLPRMKQELAQRESVKELAALTPRVPRIRVTLVGIPAERVSIDGQPRERAELQGVMLIDPGIHVFEAQAGKSVVRKEVRIAEGQALKVVLHLEESETVLPAPVAPAPALVSPPEPVHMDGAGNWMPIAGYVALGLSAVALGATIGTWVTARGVAGDLEDRCPDSRCDPVALGQEGIDDLGRYRTLRRATIALGVVSGALAAAGVTFVLVAPADAGGTAVSVHLDPIQTRIDARF